MSESWCVLVGLMHMSSLVPKVAWCMGCPSSRAKMAVSHLVIVFVVFC